MTVDEPLAGVYSISPGGGFLERLARGLSEAYPPEVLAKTKVYLPTRRACRALTEAFLEQPNAGGLLPAAYPLGDVDADDLTFQPTEPALAAAEAALDLAPAISPIRRTFLLARLAQAKHRAEHGGQMPLAAAIRLAEALARFLDDLAMEQVDAADVQALDPGGYAEHWRRVLQFLEIVLEHWPAELQALDRMDPAARRERLLAAQADAWAAAPPDTPLIIAGSTGALASTRALMRATLLAPLGAVVLPGFDAGLKEADLTLVRKTPSHPQHAMAGALDDLDVSSAAVRAWPAELSPVPAARAQRRSAFVAEALLPAAAVSRWSELAPGAFDDAAEGLVRVDAPNEDMEARAIAVFLREHAEAPAARTALVTPDRGLARRVTAELRRWGIEADDSAGRPLGETAVGVYLRLAARAFRPGAGAIDRLAFLKHPLASGGQNRARFRRRARALERAVWRDENRQRAPSFGAAAALLERSPHAADQALAPYAERLARLGAPLEELAAGGAAPFRDLITAHIEVAEAFARTDTGEGADMLWRQEDGEAAAALLADMLDAADAAPALDPADYADAFDALLAGAAVRPRAGGSGSVAILGVLEARLGRYDAIALGGLDEGLWPRQPPADPWFSRAMRREIGLSDPDRRIGLAAHDFVEHLTSPHVLLARSRRRDGAPTKPSRWLERLDATLKATGGLPLGDAGAEYLEWAANLDPTLPSFEIPPPKPRPPLAARPRRLSVTRIKQLRDDPYAIYARYVLRLRALKPLDPAPGVADRGRMVHKVFERFYRAWPDGPPEDVEAALTQIADEEFQALAGDPAAEAFWRPAFARAAVWAADMEPRRWRDLDLRQIEAEIQGEAALVAAGGPFTVDARADRVDVLRDGALAIVDVKTGTEPSRSALLSAKEPQMPLEAAIARYGGFGAYKSRDVAELAIWRVGGQGQPRTVVLSGEAVQTALTAAWEGLGRLIAGFDDPGVPYLSEPRADVSFSDYRALARLGEELEERG